jgi:hypothetical protein
MPKRRPLPINAKAYRLLVRPAGRFSLTLILAVSLFYPVFWATGNYLRTPDAFSLAFFLSFAVIILPWLCFLGPKIVRKITLIITILAAAALYISPAVVILALPILAAIVIIRSTSGDDEVHSNRGI